MQLYFKEYGEQGPALIVLHGLFGAGGNWHTLASRAFAAHFRVFTVDQRNHGRSPHSDELDYPLLAGDIRSFLEQQGLSSASLLGHSMGGKTAMTTALLYPDLVEKLVVVDMAPRAYPAHHDAILEALTELHPEQYASRQEIDEALARRIDSMAIRQFLLKNLKYDPGTKRYDWQMNLEVIARNYDRLSEAIPEDGRFEGPTLFIRGGRSGYIRDEDEADIRRHFPASQIVTIPDSGHWVHADTPEVFAEKVVVFLTA